MYISELKEHKYKFILSGVATFLFSLITALDVIYHCMISTVDIGPLTLIFTHFISVIIFAVFGFLFGLIYQLLFFLFTFFIITNNSFISSIFLLLGVETLFFSKKKLFNKYIYIPVIALVYAFTAGPLWFCLYSFISRVSIDGGILDFILWPLLSVLPESILMAVALFVFFNFVPESIFVSTTGGLLYKAEGNGSLFQKSKFASSIIYSRVVNIILLGFFTVLFFCVLNKDKYLDSPGKLPSDTVRFILCICIVATPSIYFSNLSLNFKTIQPLRRLINFLKSYVLVSDDVRATYSKRIMDYAPPGDNEFKELYNAIRILVSSIQDFIDRIKANSHLEDELKIAEAASEAKSSFLSNMSHEIRTPINSIIGMDEIILREEKDPQIRQYASNIQKSSKILIQLINDILDFSKIEAGKMEILPDEYDLSSSIADMCNMIRTRANDKGLDFIVKANPDTPFSLFGDEIRVKQCAINILTNAVKYTKQGSVTFLVDFEKIDQDYINLILSVSDTGIGIKQEDIQKLFAPFQRIEENRNRTIEGTGLGMSIVKRLLDMMGSRIEVMSEYGKGSTFTFRVKQRVLSWEGMGDFSERDKLSAQSASTYVETFHAPDAHVLVVDDVRLNLEVIKGLLKPTLVQVDLAESGKEMLELTSKKIYDIIFIDHRMPGMDGVEALQAMKASSLTLSNSAPCIALTANAVSGAKELYIDSGFNDYLSKPVDSVLLEKMLLQYLPPSLVVKQGDEGFVPLETEEAALEIVEDVKLEAIEKCQGIDVKTGLKNCQTSEILYDAVKNFYTMISSKTELINTLVSEQNWKDYTTQVHALKSSARIIGAEELSFKAAHLEECGNQNRIEEILSLTPEFIEMYTKYKEYLKPISDEENTDNLEEMSEEELQKIFANIKTCLDDFDWDGVDEQMELFKTKKAPAQYKEKLEKINELVVSVDRDGLINLL